MAQPVLSDPELALSVQGQSALIRTYGVLYLAFGLVLLIIWLGRATTTLRTLGLVVDSALFCVAGTAVLERSLLAVPIIWVVVALSAFATLLRGLVPVEILGWILDLSAAVWYTHNRSRRPETTSVSSAYTLTALLLVSVAVGISYFQYRSSRANLSDRTMSAVSTTHVDPFREFGGHEIYIGDRATIKRSELMAITPLSLIRECGRPLTDAKSTIRSKDAFVWPERKMSYGGENGEVVTIEFVGLIKGEWDLPRFLNSAGMEYSVESDENLNHLISILPCLS